ncbi:hypothetical protein LR48_Vigan02g272200 [Vigna angularis]|uniref:Uncharacterized protein n=1 Tax=Phaseolus angularis TaxID=3914 RepID=A0A0L9U1N1_PHAAN|nr:hypothetical protein LR48_Vigan02g272200 [Vigna angularis]
MVMMKGFNIIRVQMEKGSRGSTSKARMEGFLFPVSSVYCKVIQDKRCKIGVCG